LQIQQQKIEYISVIGSMIGSSMCPEFITAPINISNAVSISQIEVLRYIRHPFA